MAARYSRHRIVIATQAASMVLTLVLAGLTLAGRRNVRGLGRWVAFAAMG